MPVKLEVTYKPRINLRRRTGDRGPESLANPLDGMVSRGLDIKPAFRHFIGEGRKVVAGEIRGEYWLPRSGPKKPWKKRHGFGSRVLPASVFGADYIAAWEGGAGSIEVVADAAAAFGVSGARFPWASLHRGGTDAIRAGDVSGKGILVSSLAQVKPWKRTKGTRWKTGPQQWAIWWKIFFDFGIRLKRKTLEEGLFTPFRPHATKNPETVTRLTAIMSAYVTGRRMPVFQ